MATAIPFGELPPIPLGFRLEGEAPPPPGAGAQPVAPLAPRPRAGAQAQPEGLPPIPPGFRLLPPLSEGLPPLAGAQPLSEGAPAPATTVSPQQLPAVSGEPAAVSEEPKAPVAVTRGAVQTFTEQNPTLFSEFFEMISDDVPEALKERTKGLSKSLKDISGVPGPEYKKKMDDIFEAEDFGDVVTFAGEAVGQGFASSLPIIGGGVLGAGAGAAALGPVGGAVGGATGALGTSYMMAAGEVYASLKAEGVEPEVAKWWAYRAGFPIAALDTALLATVAGRALPARNIATEAIKKNVLKWMGDVGKEIPKTAAIEAGTEGAQSAIGRGTVTLATGKPFATEENAKGIINEAIAGAFGGAPFGAVAPTVQQLVSQPKDLTPELLGLSPATEGEIARAFREAVLREEEGLPTPTITERPELREELEGVAQAPGPRLAAEEEALISQSIQGKIGRARNLSVKTIPAEYGPIFNVTEVVPGPKMEGTHGDLWISYDSTISRDTGGFRTQVDFGGAEIAAGLGIQEGLARLTSVADSIRHFIQSAKPMSLAWMSADPKLDRLYDRVAKSIAKEFGGVVDFGNEEQRDFGFRRITFANFDKYGKAAQPKAVEPQREPEGHLVDARPLDAVAPARAKGPGAATLGQGVDVHIEVVKRAARVANAVAKRLGLNVPVDVELHGAGTLARAWGDVSMLVGPNKERWGWDDLSEDPMRHAIRPENVTGVRVRLAVPTIKNPTTVYSVMMHELGHALVFTQWLKAPLEVRVAIEAAYKAWRQKMADNPAAFLTRRAVSQTSRDFIMQQHEIAQGNVDVELGRIDRGWVEYYRGMTEWMAEQVARWATTDAKPLGVVDKFFKGLADQIRAAWREFVKTFPILEETFGSLTEMEKGLPAPAVQQWLDSLWANNGQQAAQISLVTQQQSTALNTQAMKAIGVTDFPETPMTEATIHARTALRKLFPNRSMPPQVRATQTAADFWYSAFKYMVDLAQLADKNWHIVPLQRYRELISIAHRTTAEWHARAEDTLKEGYRLGEQQSRAYTKLVDSYINMLFLTKEEREAGIERRPTREEFAKLVKDAGADDQVIRFFARTVKDYEAFAKAIFSEVRRKIGAIPDLGQQAQEYAAVEAAERAWLQKPYAPALRYGKFAINIYGEDGTTIAFLRFESKREQMRNLRLVGKILQKGERAQVSILPESALPFSGLPPKLIDLIERRLNLSDQQRAALGQLRFEVSPDSSFMHRFQKRTLMPGYSTDFLRSYSHYFFHGARYLARIMHADQLREHADAIRHSVKDAADGNKRSAIANFVADHLEKRFLNPRADWAIARTIAFHMWISGKVASASLNLTQTFISTQPFLAKDFGDLEATAAVANAARRVRNFYTERAVRASTAAEDRAISEGLRLEDIKSTFAADLAGLSEGRNLLRGFGGNRPQRIVNSGFKAAAFMFSTTEQANRRISFMAGWRLAMDNPAETAVSQARDMWRRTYDDLLDRGFLHHEASAIVYAHHITRITQGDYASYARPRFMTGPGSAIFALRTFQHKMLYNLWAFPTAGIRMALVMAFMGGLMGLPGGEDAAALMRAIAFRLFGKDFDLEQEARSVVVEYLGAEYGKYAPDYFARGVASRGYGIPDLVDYIGEKVGMERIPGAAPEQQQFVPLPVFDRSRTAGLGPILPVDVGALLGPKRDTRRDLGGVARAGGVYGGYAYNVYDFLGDPTDPKKVERLLPSAFGFAAKAVRFGLSGGEVNARGNMVVRFDPYDIQDMLELVGLGMGYQPARRSQKWNLIIAQSEVDAAWDLRRGTLMTQAWTANQSRRGGDREDWNRVMKAIRDFNEQVRRVPELRGRAITRDTLDRSFKMREKWKRAHETGVPLIKGDRPLAEQIQKLYPSAQVDATPERVAL